MVVYVSRQHLTNTHAYHMEYFEKYNKLLSRALMDTHAWNWQGEILTTLKISLGVQALMRLLQVCGYLYSIAGLVIHFSLCL